MLFSTLLVLCLTIGSVSALDNASLNGDSNSDSNINISLDDSLIIDDESTINNSINDDYGDINESSNNSGNNFNADLENSNSSSNNSSDMLNSDLNSTNSSYNNSNVSNISNNSNIKKYVTVKQVYVAAASFKRYYDNYLKFPNTITVGNYKLTGNQFIYLMANALKQINSKTNNKILVIDVKPNSYSGNLIYSNVKKANYLVWAKDTAIFAYHNNYLPSYHYYSKLKVDSSTYAYAFSKILAYYNSHKKLPTTCYVEKITQTKGNVVKLGSNKYGSVQFIGPIGNTESRVKIAYVIGVHVREYQAHDALWAALNKKASSLNCCYYVYKIKLAKVSGSYSKDRLKGQLLSKKFILPHAKKQKYNLLIDIHSSISAKKGGAYKYNYFMFVPDNKNKTVKSWIKKIISKSPGMVYFYPTPQTSPAYMTLPLLQSGTPTMVFETLTDESPSKSLSRLTNLISAVNNLFK